MTSRSPLIDSIIKANDNLSESLQSNNWELMGADIQRLQELIETLKKQVEEEKASQNGLDGQNSTQNENTIEENTNIENSVTE